MLLSRQHFERTKFWFINLGTKIECLL